MNPIYDIIIIGAGPAGLTAAIYARRNGKRVLLMEKEGFGGQIAMAPLVENYPGVGSVPGAELADAMASQVTELETDIEFAAAISIETDGDRKIVRTEDGGSFQARAVILAVGARHRSLGLPGEEELLGHGLSCCAVCDGAFYAHQDVAIVGGGDSALQEAILLAGICRRVTLIHRRESFRGDEKKLSTLRQRENVVFLTPKEIVGFETGDGELSGLRLKDCRSGAEERILVRALFVSVGREPALGDFAGALPLSQAGYAAAGENCVAGDGIFVAGDCREKSVRQLATAVGDGAAAAMAACRYLET